MSVVAFLSLLVSRCVAASTFEANVSSARVQLSFPLLGAVGSGHAALALRADYRTALAAVQRDIHFGFVRAHGWLNDDMSTLLGGHANLYNIFSNIDFFLSVGARPILELSFMPRALASDPSSTVFHYEGGTSPPADWDAWGSFIRELFTALAVRYGVDELRHWRVEVWNEPDSNAFWNATRQQYLQLYNVTARAVKSVDARIPVGGPATASCLWVRDGTFAAAVRAAGAPIDFLSAHLYPTDGVVPPLRDGFETVVNETAAATAATALPLLMTEFNAGLWIDKSDEPYSAAFIAHAALAFQGVPVEVLSYWTFSDVFEEDGLLSAPYAPPTANQKYGMQTLYGVPKPSYRALQLVAGHPRMSVEGVVTYASGDRGPSATVAAPSPTGGATLGTLDVLFGVAAGDEPGVVRLVALVTNFNAIPAGVPPLPIAVERVTLRFTGLPPAAHLPASATVRRIDSTHAYAKRVWLAAGSPDYPTAAEVADELAASALVAEAMPLDAGAAAGTASISLDLEPYAVAQVELQYI